MDDEEAFATRAVHAGVNHVDGAVNTPVFLSSTYELTEERYAGWAAGAQHTLLYGRMSSVNSEAVSVKLAALEGGEDADVFSSGMGAITTTLLSLLSSGDHIVASPDVYGGTYELMAGSLPRFGIEVTMADMRDPASYEAAIRPNTKMLYAETLTNPVLKVCDLPAMASIAQRHGLISVVDNTFATPWACNPLSLGFDIVIHSTTKYLGGHSDIVGGVVIGGKDHITQVFNGKKTFGTNADPFSCYMLERGVRTLHTRMPVHASNAAELARRLEAHPRIASVLHTTLPSHPDHEVAQRVMPKGTGMLAFVVADGNEAALSMMRKLSIVFEATSLGGVESLIECPFNSSHMAVPEDVRTASGILPGFVRLSVGIEDIEDLWRDFEQALAG